MVTGVPTLFDEARDVLEDAIALRRRIHRRPELGLRLPETQAAVLESLDGLGVETTTGEATSSVVGVIDGGRPGGTILLRADMDALPMPEDTGLEYASEIPGAMHACGHDAHVAMLAGAARLLSARRADLRGRVVLMFQPGEEGHHGARLMIEEGLLDGDPRPDAAFAIHITPSRRSGSISTRGGPLLAAADELHVTVTGRGGHASMPHLALDPIPVACEIVQAIQTLVTRSVDAFDPAVVTVARIAGGTTTNVIPESVQLDGTIRTVSERTRARVHEAVRTMTTGIAAAHGAEASVQILEGYPVTVNDDDFAGFVLEVAGELLPDGAVRQMGQPVMGAEDFSYVLQRVRGAMAYLGARPEGVDRPAPNHSNRMVIDEQAMATGIALHAAVALRWLERSG